MLLQVSKFSLKLLFRFPLPVLSVGLQQPAISCHDPPKEICINHRFVTADRETRVPYKRHEMQDQVHIGKWGLREPRSIFSTQNSQYVIINCACTNCHKRMHCGATVQVRKLDYNPATSKWEFLKNAQVGSGAHAWASGTEYRKIFPHQCEVDATRRTLPHSAEVKSAWCYTSSPPSDFVACTGTTSSYPTRHAAHSSALNSVFPSLPQQLN